MEEQFDRERKLLEVVFLRIPLKSDRFLQTEKKHHVTLTSLIFVHKQKYE